MEPVFEKEMAFSRLTTMRTGGRPEYFVRPSSFVELANALSWAKSRGMEVFCLGNGSNVVVSDSGLPGLTVSMVPRMSSYRLDGKELVVQAGALWPWIVRKMILLGLGGIECGAGIPGSMGGALAMNAGTPGCFISDAFVSAKVVRKSDGRCFNMSAAEMEFGEKSSILLEDTNLIVTEMKFHLYPNSPARLAEEMVKRLKIRRGKQPQELANAGCIFRRDGDILPGRLIDKADCKGMRVGRAEVSKKHANFIVNHGGATSADIWKLKEIVRERVRERFGVELSFEVRFIGDYSDCD